MLTRPFPADLPRAARPLFNRLAQGWQHGALTVRLPSGADIQLGGDAPGANGSVVLQNWRTPGRVLTKGGIGFAEGYLAGEWDTPDLTQLLIALVDNAAPLAAVFGGSRIARWLAAALHAFNRNTRTGSKRNILAHYDLGNSFFERWLDPGMTYSSARFTAPGQDLEAAQREKYAHLARMIAIEPGHKVLEIGCGWGGFAHYVATEIGAHVTGVTISRAQYAHAAARLQAEGLNDRVSLKLVDYRDIEGAYDRIASIEMVEAVGEAYWPAYFAKVRASLAPSGRVGLQLITIRDDLFDAYRRRVDFIQRHIFPGGMLPSPSRLRAEAARAGLALHDELRFGDDYALTLAQWRDAFDLHWPSIAPLGFDERFRRLWRYYLSYCEAGFRTGRTDVVQVALGHG